MFDLEKSINKWKKSLRKYQSIEDGYADELENHLRDIIDQLILEGNTEEKAFQIAMTRIGDSEKISREYFSENNGSGSKRPPWQDHPFVPSLMMNYFKIAMRNIRRYKGYSLINIIGLAIGLTAFVLISLYTGYEFSYDKQHVNVDNIYRIYTQFIGHEHGGQDKMAVCRYGVGPGIKEAMPDVKAMFRLFRTSDVLFTYGEKKHVEDRIFAADPEIFDVLSLPIIERQTNKLLSTPSSLVITQSMAKKLFGEDPALGQTLMFEDTLAMTIEAIIEDIPSNSHFDFDFLYSSSGYEKVFKRDMNSWIDGSCTTYLLLRENTELSQVETKLSDLVDRYFVGGHGHGHRYNLFLQPMRDIHLYSNFAAELESNNDIDTIYLFIGIAILIMVIAALNYINLTTARSLKRGKEVAIRKTIGANRTLVARQFLSESIVMALLGFAASLLMILVFLPYFNSYVERDFEYGQIFTNGFFLPILGAIILIGIISGLYPAIIVSSFKPTTIFTGILDSGRKSSIIRGVFVVLQFAISIALIVCTIVIDGQMKYIINSDLGYCKDQVVVVETSSAKFRERLDVVKNELRSNPFLTHVSSCSYLPNEIRDQTEFNWPGKADEIEVPAHVGFADYDWVDLFGIEIVEGRNFSREYPSDAQGAFLLNETAVKALGWDNPVGRELTHWNDVTGEVVGVMKDFNFQSLYQEIEPLYIFFEPSWRNYYLTAKIAGGHINEALDYLEAKMNEFVPGSEFNYTFFDEEFNRQYKDELKLQTLFKVFSFVAIFISALGLIGLAAYTTERRTKEIGVRKVMGASISSILLMLVKEFTKWVALANLIAWPISYYFMEKWLSDFVFRIDLALWIFLISGVIGFVIAVGSVAYQSLKAALTNPVNSLRYE